MSSWAKKLPPHDMYVELFSGTSSMLFEKPMGFAELYVEVEEDVTDFFAVLRMDVDRFKKFLVTGEKPVDGHRIEKWDRLREMFINFSASEYRVILEKESGYRALSQNLRRTLDSVDVSLSYIVSRLRCVQLESRRFDDILKRFDTPSTLFYADVTRLPDDVTLDEVVARLSRIRGKGVLYGADGDLGNLIDEGWYKVERLGEFDTWVNF